MKAETHICFAAIVPMRHFSERVPGKNYRSFAGAPLFHCVVQSLLACPEIDRVIIDTDSPVVRESSHRTFPDVTVLERPEHLRDDMTPMNEVLLHTTSQVAADYYLQTHSTNPLLTPGTISRAIRLFLESRDEHDSLFSVTRLQTRLWGEDGKPLNHDPARLVRTQDLPPVYEENSCLYLFSRESLLNGKNRIGVRPLMFEMDPIEAWDIDVETDFRIAEHLYLDRDRAEGGR